ncbi:MAG: hypothetical protein M0019_08485 [Actinomycetota bacterium]|nr:hypothetical protein [Actinomycetota bacterium]
MWETNAHGAILLSRDSHMQGSSGTGRFFFDRIWAARLKARISACVMAIFVV